MEISRTVALVTGAGSGIGFGIATALLKAGAKVAVTDRQEDRLQRAQELLQDLGQCSFHQLDVTERQTWADVAEKIEASLGPVQILINNAGVNLFTPLAQASFDDLDWVMEVNLGGVLNGLATFLPRMLATGEEGWIVNTGSMAAFLPGPPALYTASKFAVRGLTESLRSELRETKIGLTLLCPGLVKSDIHLCHQARPERLGRCGQNPKATQERLEKVRHLGIDPLEVGRLLVRAIQLGAPYVFTHPEFKGRLSESFAEVLGLYPSEEVE